MASADLFTPNDELVLTPVCGGAWPNGKHQYDFGTIQTGPIAPGGKLNPPIDAVGGCFAPSTGATDLFCCTGFKF